MFLNNITNLWIISQPYCDAQDFNFNPFRPRYVDSYVLANLSTAPDIQVRIMLRRVPISNVNLLFHINGRWISSQLLHIWSKSIYWVILDTTSTQQQLESFIYWSGNGSYHRDGGGGFSTFSRDRKKMDNYLCYIPYNGIMECIYWQLILEMLIWKT